MLLTCNGTDKKYWHGDEGHWGARGENVSISANVLKQYFFEKSQTERFLTFFLQKSNTFRQLSPLDRRSLKPAFRELDFVNKMSRL